MVNFKDETKDDKFEEMREKEEEDLSQILATRYKIPYLDLSRMSIDLDALKQIPQEKAKEAKVAAFQKAGKKIQLAIESPNPEKTKIAIKELEEKGFNVTLFMVSNASLERAWKRYSEIGEYIESTQGIVDVSAERIKEFISKVSSIEELKNIFKEIVGSKNIRNISKVLEIILAGAIASDASDIHIEPQEEEVRLRFRLDGVLHDIFYFDNKTFKLLLSRIKLISGLKLNVKDQAQDGRFSIEIDDSEIDIRVSVIPENYGESIVMRTLNPKNIAVDLEEMGMRKEFLETLYEQLSKPNGMILTTGPTGSGKTSTLYACLKKIYKPEIKIVTLEDPVEYHLKGIIQTQIEEGRGYTFASGLRAILRQDPDVILLGEIRDGETAGIAIQAALTGHLVLSTLHTNDAAGTISRLMDLGVNPTTIAPAINITMAQRLARRLCVKCKEEHVPEDKERNLIEEILKTIPGKYNPPKIEDVRIWKPKGCSECNNLGYIKRVGLFEGILIDEKIEKLITKNPTISEIWEAAKEQEILTMKQDGIMKAIEGVTSLEEVRRVIGF